MGSGKLIGKTPVSVWKVQAAKESTSNTADDLESQITAAQQKQKQLEKKRAKVEKDLKAIDGAKKNVKKYIRKLDAKLNELTQSIDENEKEIASIQKQMDDLDEELELVQGKQQSQYESMKSRIKYMYENANDNYIEMLLEARSLSELYSRAEYIEKITGYDKNLLVNYQTVVNEVVVAREEVSNKLNELKVTKDTLRYEKSTIKSLVKQKNEQMKIYEGNISNTQSDIADYAEQISGQEDEIEGLLQKQRQQIADQEAANKASGGQVVETSGNYAWPLTLSGRISSYFGYRNAPTAGASSYHKGIDIAASIGTSILATKGGQVVTATYSTSAGNYIAIYHGNGTYSYYMHCSSLSVSIGDKVKKGQIIGKVGSTGISTGPHLHFAIYKNGNYVNPLGYVSQP